MRRVLVAVLMGCVALVTTSSAAATTITVTTTDGRPTVTWAQPAGYPDAYVDYVEIGSTTDTDANGFFLLGGLVDSASFLTAEESAGAWGGDEPLSPGVTYYAHVEVYRESNNTITWSDVVAFTVGGPAADSSGAGPQSPPVPGSEPPASDSAVPVVLGGGQPPAYRTRARKTPAVLVLGFREPGQHDDEWRRYRVCWTEVNRLRCQKRTIAAGAWDDLRLPLVPSLGTTVSGHRVADVTWFVDEAKVAARRVRLGDQ